MHENLGYAYRVRVWFSCVG